MVSILIPTLRNLNYLQAFCNSLKKHTTVPYEVIVWSNEHKDQATKEFCNRNEYLYFESKENMGITKPYNVMVENAKYDLIFLASNDYYVLPGWDQILKHDTEVYWKRPAFIDPRNYMYTKSIVRDYGNDLYTFQERQLLSNFRGVTVPEIEAHSMPPVMKKQDYINIGGMCEDYIIGETDFLYKAFCYYNKHQFKQSISTNSFIYHFGTKTHRSDLFREHNELQKSYLISTYNKTEEELCDIMQLN